MLEGLIPERSADDFASGVIRVQLGREEFLLEELPMEQMDAWSAGVDKALADLLAGLDEDEDPADVVKRLAQERPRVVAALVSYPGMPDEKWVTKHATHSQVLRALMGVWSAANPLVGASVEAIVAMKAAIPRLFDGNVSALMSSLRRTSDGPSGDSGESSPTPSSAPVSTLPTSVNGSSTSTGSKQHGSGTSSPATPRRSERGTASKTASDRAPRPRKPQPTSSVQ